MLLLRRTVCRSLPQLHSFAFIQSSAPNRPMAGNQTAKANSATPAKAGTQTIMWNSVPPEKVEIQAAKMLKFVMPGPHLLEYWNDGQSGDYIYYACKNEEQFARITNVLPDRKIEFSKEAINTLLAKEIPTICRIINEGKGRDLIEQGLLSITDYNKLSKTRLLHPSRQCIAEPSNQWDVDVRTMNGNARIRNKLFYVYRCVRTTQRYPLAPDPYCVDDEKKAFIDCRLDYSFGYLSDEELGNFPDNTSLYAFVRNCISHIIAAKLDSTIEETNLILKRKISLSKYAKESSDKSGNIFFDSISFRVTCSRQIKPVLGEYFISRLSVLCRDTGEYIS